jgi:hypothetical protein
MVDKLTSTASVIAALRAEMNNRTDAAGRRTTRRSESPEKGKATRDISVLRAELAELVKPVAADDLAAVKAVRPKVVKAILLWEFGPAMREHPEWQPMLESITESLEAHPPHAAQFQQLIADLKR